MKFKTCGSCEDVKIYKSKFPDFAIAYCGRTGNHKTGVVVPHNSDGDSKTITYTRVPNFCTNENAEKSETQANKKDWITIKI
jgi:hypothetical protein